MIYRGPRFSRGLLIWFIAHPLPPPPLPSESLTNDTQDEKERQLAHGRGARSFDRKKAWSSINRSILSAFEHPFLYFQDLLLHPRKYRCMVKNTLKSTGREFFLTTPMSDFTSLYCFFFFGHLWRGVNPLMGVVMVWPAATGANRITRSNSFRIYRRNQNNYKGLVTVCHSFCIYFSFIQYIDTFIHMHS